MRLRPFWRARSLGHALSHPPHFIALEALLLFCARGATHIISLPELPLAGDTRGLMIHQPQFMGSRRCYASVVALLI